MRLIVERKMTPILSKSLESESAACIPPQIMAVCGLAISSAATNGERRFFHVDFKNVASH